MLSGRLSFISQGAKPGVMSVGASIKGSGRGGSGRGDNGGAMSSAGLETTKLSNYDEVNK